MRHIHLLAFTLMVCLEAGCGGGGGDPTPPVTVTLVSTASLDGSVGRGGDVGTSGDVVQAGDSTTNLGYRGFVSFDLTGIPANATIDSASLRLVQKQVMGAPYATLGTVLVDQVVYGSVLDAGAYDRSFPAFQAFATLSSDAVLEAKSVDATGSVRGDVESLRLQSQFRLRFTVESDNDSAFDLANFHSGDALTPADRPTLTVTYRP